MLSSSLNRLLFSNYNNNTVIKFVYVHEFKKSNRSYIEMCKILTKPPEEIHPGADGGR